MDEFFREMDKTIDEFFSMVDEVMSNRHNEQGNDR